MTELEQLRKEVNELRERLARVEQGAARFTPLGPTPQAPPVAFPTTWQDMQELAKHFPPGTVLC